MTRNKNLWDLSPNFWLRFSMGMDEYNNLYREKMFVTETTRTKEQQALEVAAWNSKTMKSNHLTGNAVDVAFRLWWKKIYPNNNELRMRENLCWVMRKYGIVNAFYDLARWFDKMHFQAHEVQKPDSKYLNNPWYTLAWRWKENLLEEMENNSRNRHLMVTDYNKIRLHNRNQQIRLLLWIPQL